MPRHCDSSFVEWAGRSYLRDIAQAGVKVYLYDKGFLHSKILVCDDTLATCGSTNVDSRSFENNFEANAFFYDKTTALRFKEIFMHDLNGSTALDKVAERKSPDFYARLWESLTRLLSPLL